MMPPLGNPVTRLRYDRGLLVDPAPVRAHVQRLRDAGMTDNMITRAAGIGQGTLQLLAGNASVTKTTADAVLSVTPRPSKHQGLVMAFGARRRIEAMLLAGHPLHQIGAEMGRHPTFVDAVTRRKHILWQTHVAVDQAYNRLLGKVGTSTQSRNVAVKRGYMPALAWDDIDDYFERPDKSVLWAPSKRSEKADRLERIKELGGLPDSVVAARLGLALRVVERDRAELRRAAA